MEEKLKILDAHECNWANQHKGVEVINYDPEGWTLFADHSKMIHNEDEEDDDMQYRISISYCPFCGLKL